MRNWINSVKRINISEAATKLGMKRLRMNSLSPCPNCGREQRNKSDKRGPIGTNDKTWACFRCAVSGDVVDLVSFNLYKSKMKDLDSDNKSKVKQWFEDCGYLSTTSKKIVPVDSFVQKPEPRKQEVDTKSDFGFSIKNIESYHDNLINNKTRVYKYLTQDRKLTEETIKHFKLGHARIQNKDWLTIPLMNKFGKIVNCKYRSIPNSASGKKQYRMCKGAEVPLFLSNELSPSNGYAICVEGEIDAMTLHQLGMKGKVCATTSGAATKWTDEWLDCIEPFSSIYIWYDDDKAGKEGGDSLAEKLGHYRCLKIVSKYNDANEGLQNGMSTDDIAEEIVNAQGYIKEELRKANFYTKELEQLILNPTSLKGLPTGSAKLDKCLGGIRDGLWIVTGDTGNGKTTWATWLLHQQSKNGVPTMITSFEQRPIGTVQKLLRMQLGDDFMKVSVAERNKAMASLSSVPLYLMDHYGELEYSKLIDVIRFAKRRHGVKILLIDHLGFIAKKQDKEDERQAIERVVRDLATIAVNDKLTIVLVCHPNNISVHQNRRVKISDLKGASAIRQDAHVGIVVQRQDPTDQRPFPCSTIHFDKIRSEFGRNGSRVTLAFDPLSCVYADEWNLTPSGSKGKKLVKPVKQKP